MLEGECRLAVDGQPALTLRGERLRAAPFDAGLRLFRASNRWSRSTSTPASHRDDGDEVRHGRLDGDPDMRLLGGYFAFDAPDPVLVASVLPAIVHVRGAERLSTLVRLVGDESLGAATGP